MVIFVWLGIAHCIKCIFALQCNTVSHWVGANLGFHPANERRRYKVTPSLIGWPKPRISPVISEAYSSLSSLWVSRQVPLSGEVILVKVKCNRCWPEYLDFPYCLRQENSCLVHVLNEIAVNFFLIQFYNFIDFDNHKNHKSVFCLHEPEDFNTCWIVLILIFERRRMFIKFRIILKYWIWPVIIEEVPNCFS